MFPVGSLEIVPGVTLGAARFAQRATQAGAGGQPVTVRDHAVEFLAAPSLSVHARAARVLFIPELQYCLAGHPDLSWRAPHRGLIASLRIVLPIEIDRIRH